MIQTKLGKITLWSSLSYTYASCRHLFQKEKVRNPCLAVILNTKHHCMLYLQYPQCGCPNAIQHICHICFPHFLFLLLSCHEPRTQCSIKQRALCSHIHQYRGKKGWHFQSILRFLIMTRSNLHLETTRHLNDVSVRPKRDDSSLQRAQQTLLIRRHLTVPVQHDQMLN